MLVQMVGATHSLNRFAEKLASAQNLAWCRHFWSLKNHSQSPKTVQQLVDHTSCLSWGLQHSCGLGSVDPESLVPSCQELQHPHQKQVPGDVGGLLSLIP